MSRPEPGKERAAGLELVRQAMATRLAPARAVADRVSGQVLDAFMAQIAPLFSCIVPQRRAVIVPEGDTLVLHEQAGRGPLVRRGPLDEADAAVPGRFAIIDLRLPADQMLRRSLTLPSAGRDYLPSIIAHRLERLTPWRMDKVLHGFAVSPEERTDGSLAVDLLAMSADRLAPVLDRLAARGFVPTSLGSVEDAIDAPPRIDLYAGRPATADRATRRWVARIAIGTITVLLAACLASAWVAQEAEAEQAETTGRLAALRSRLQAHRGGGTSHERALIEAHREASALVLIDGLSAAIPDTTVLREINLSSGKVRLAGRSSDAPALIKQLEGRAGLTGVRFAAPVVRDAAGRDLFEITAERPGEPKGAGRGTDPAHPFRGPR
ncbi:PilN domain-containing protein [Methylobacterium sp. J-076]|uniref:PilN domain-containing protein n=1 Tax=Methylobacterium sp. J-076 TaxID=2836655 RepID=UPI001FB90287|nr:PilN domain-containing protein [Methylobacterium sp. J-076]MCJ2011907.1 PilN domain-containing protein [Methylobacterium sp. J-076]